MRKNNRIIYVLLIVMTFVLVFLFKGNNTNNMFEDINLENGAVVELKNNEYKTLNFQNGSKYEGKASFGIYSFDIASKSFILEKDNERYVKSKEKEFKIEDTDISNLELSPNGKYISYFLRNEEMGYKIIDIEKEKTLELNSRVNISGEILQWLNEDTIIYYGISEDKINGVFKYDLNTMKEEILIKLDAGIISYLEVIGEDIYYLENNYRGKSQILYKVDKELNVEKLSNEIEKIYDIEEGNGKVYILGKVKGNNISIYNVEDNQTKRVVFDFPSNLNFDKGLSKDIDGNILFTGKNSVEELDTIYKIEDDSILFVEENQSEYFFVNMK